MIECDELFITYLILKCYILVVIYLIFCLTKACGIELESCHAGTSEGAQFLERPKTVTVSLNFSFFLKDLLFCD